MSIIIPFGDTLFAFQLKSRVQEKPPSEIDKIDIQRIQKKVNEGVEQLKTTKRALEQNVIGIPTNSRGIEVPFNWNSINNVVGIVLIHLEGEEIYSKEDRTSIDSAVAHEHGFPIHVFVDNDFEEVIKYNDTLGDLKHYLHSRYKLLSNGALFMLGPELTLLELYLMRPDIIKGYENGQYHALMLDDTVGTALSSGDYFQRQQQRLNLSYVLFDNILATAYTTIGYDPLKRTYTSGISVEEFARYYKLISVLGQLNRENRQHFAEKLYEKMSKAEDEKQGHAAFMYPENSTLFLVSSLDEASREKRMEWLYGMTISAYIRAKENCDVDIDVVFGICTEPASEINRSYDSLYLEEQDILKRIQRNNNDS